MDAESDYEIKRARDAIQTIETIQSMIDVSADILEGLRTQCSTSAELTQQEIRTLEGKLVKHFSRQLCIKEQLGEELQRELRHVPCLAQWLRVVGLCPDSIESVCGRVGSLEELRKRSDRELGALLAAARDEEVRRLCRAMQRLASYTEALGRGEGGADLPLFWDSWERHARSSPRPRAHHSHNDHHAGTPAKKGGKSPTTPVSKRKQNSSLPAPQSLTKSRSHESQLSVRPDASDLSDNSQSSALGTQEGSPPASPRLPDSESTPLHRPLICNNNATFGAPRSPRTPTVSRCMAHDIAHRFTKTFNMIATCDYCDKQMLFGSGLKCKECKFKCHRDCESKVPPSCGLPPEFVVVFKEKFHKDAAPAYYCSSPVAARGAGGAGFLASLTHRPRRRHAPPPHHHHSVTGRSGVLIEHVIMQQLHSVVARVGRARAAHAATCARARATRDARAPPAAPAAAAAAPPQAAVPLPRSETACVESEPHVVGAVPVAGQRPARQGRPHLQRQERQLPRRVAERLGLHGQRRHAARRLAGPVQQARLAVAQAEQPVNEGVGHPVRRAEAVRGDRARAVRHRVPGQLARRGRRQTAARALAQRRHAAAGHVQARGGDIPEDPTREPSIVYGRVHEASPAGHRDVTLQGHDAVHAHPPAQGQVHCQQERAGGAADITGYGVLARARHRPQGPQDEEHLPGEREGGHHRLRPLQRHQAVLRRQRPRRQPGHPGRLAVLPGARAGARPAPARLAAPALLQGHRRLRLRHGVVRAPVRRVPVQGAAAGGHHLAGGQGRQAVARQHAGLQGHQGHPDGVLGVPRQRARRVPAAAEHAAEAAAQAPRALALAPRAPLALRRLRVLSTPAGRQPEPPFPLEPLRCGLRT